MNQERFKERLAFIESTLKDNGLSASDITPIDYDETLPFPYNNFIYKVTLSTPAGPDAFLSPGPCTRKVPADGLSTFVVRLSNPAAEGLNHANRVANEVASMHLAREGLASFRPDMEDAIPAIYAWRPADTKAGTMGWIVMEFKGGMPLDKAMPAMSASQRDDVLGQLADVFAGIQRAPLPDSLDAYGGIDVDETGQLVPGQMTTLSGGPWPSYGRLWDTRIAAQLEGADGSAVLDGWKPNGVRDRITKLVDAGLDSVLRHAGADVSQRVLVHGDLTTNNVLFEPAANKVTGLVDFDFASVCHPCHEFFTSFGDIGGSTNGGDVIGRRLSEALVTGNFDPDNVPDEMAEIWATATAWDRAMAARQGLVRPSQLAGIRALTQLGRLEGLLCPFRLVHPVFLRRMTPEQTADARVAAEQALESCLSSLGF